MEKPEPTELAKAEFDKAVLAFTEEMDLCGAYMPSLATYLRLHADELADKFPDDINQGRGMQGVLV